MLGQYTLSTLALGLVTACYAAPTATTAAAKSTCTGTNLLTNPGFEKGSAPWVYTGGAAVLVNGESNPWSFTTTDGTHFGLLTSNATIGTSTIAQTVSGISSDTLKLSFDWQFEDSTTQMGPPRFPCTLDVNMGIETPTSWTYDAATGGNGHVKTTFPSNGAGDTITFSFSCPSISSQNYAGAVIDNIKLTAC